MKWAMFQLCRKRAYCLFCSIITLRMMLRKHCHSNFCVACTCYKQTEKTQFENQFHLSKDSTECLNINEAIL